MSLVEPNIWDKIKPYKRWIIYAVLGIVLIGLVLYLWQFGSDYVFRSRVEKQKANVNAALVEANKVAANIAAEKEAANRIAQNVNIATQEYLDAVNVTDATRANVNAALERMQKAANSNTGNVNARDVENALRGL